MTTPHAALPLHDFGEFRKLVTMIPCDPRLPSIFKPLPDNLEITRACRQRQQPECLVIQLPDAEHYRQKAIGLLKKILQTEPHVHSEAGGRSSHYIILSDPNQITLVNALDRQLGQITRSNGHTGPG